MNIHLKIDDREKKSRIESARRFFEEKHISTKTDRLPIGDYLFNDKLVFEWKSPADFVHSIIDKRIFKQIQRMKQYPHKYVIIVGNVFEYLREQYIIRRRYSLKEFTVNNVLGALASILEYDKVIMVENDNQAFTIMSFLAQNILTKDKHDPIDKPVCRMSDSVGTFLCCIDNVNTKKAILIKEQLKLECLRDLLNVTREDLIGISGIGKKTADKILGEIG